MRLRPLGHLSVAVGNGEERRMLKRDAFGAPSVFHRLNDEFWGVAWTVRTGRHYSQDGLRHKGARPGFAPCGKEMLRGRNRLFFDTKRVWFSRHKAPLPGRAPASACGQASRIL
ncbi:hypothetical protein RHIZ404_190047 [Rhizobium sp. EC-SD404]|nr:hypothetical protein RHIZ404_190047 [Rhizobium sp. EC-SD404]